MDRPKDVTRLIAYSKDKQGNYENGYVMGNVNTAKVGQYIETLEARLAELEAESDDSRLDAEDGKAACRG